MEASVSNKMNISEMLNQYRIGYGLVRENSVKEKEGAGNSSMWDTAVTVPEGKTMPGWGARVELPEELPDYRDDRDMGDPFINQQNFQAYMQEHPFAVKEGDNIAAMIEELSKMVQDPENPMTYEEAERIYTEEFSKLYSNWEMGGDASVAEGNGGNR